jgi:hypothetical protein
MVALVTIGAAEPINSCRDSIVAEGCWSMRQSRVRER